MSNTKPMGANAAVAKMMSTPEGAAKIEASFAELERRVAAARDAARDAALSAAMSSLAAGGIAAADGDNEAAHDHLAAADQWTVVAKQAGA